MLPKPWQIAARAERVVEREQPRLRHFVLNAAGPAFEALAEPVHDRRSAGCLHQLDREAGAAAFGVRRLDRVGQPRPHVAVDLQAIDDDLDAAADP